MPKSRAKASPKDATPPDTDKLKALLADSAGAAAGIGAHATAHAFLLAGEALGAEAAPAPAQPVSAVAVLSGRAASKRHLEWLSTLAEQRGEDGEIKSSWALFASAYALGGGTSARVSATNALLKLGHASEARREYEEMLAYMGGGTLSPKTEELVRRKLAEAISACEAGVVGGAERGDGCGEVGEEGGDAAEVSRSATAEVEVAAAAAAAARAEVVEQAALAAAAEEVVMRMFNSLGREAAAAAAAEAAGASVAKADAEAKAQAAAQAEAVAARLLNSLGREAAAAAAAEAMAAVAEAEAAARAAAEAEAVVARLFNSVRSHLTRPPTVFSCIALLPTSPTTLLPPSYHPPTSYLPPPTLLPSHLLPSYPPTTYHPPTAL